MDDVLLLIRIVLAGIFMLAAIGKLLDPAGSAKAVKSFGVPESLAGPLVYVLPVAEVLIAVCLLFPLTSWFGAVGGSILLLSFTAGMLWQISIGKAPECHCFGQMHSEPVSARSVARNVVFASFALLLVVAGRTYQGPPLATTRDEMIQTLLLLALTVGGAVTLFLAKRVFDSQAGLMRRMELLELLSTADTPRERQEAGSPDDGLPLGALFPDFELNDRSDRAVSLDTVLMAGRPILFFFVGPNCSPCMALLPELEMWHKELISRVSVFIVTSGTKRENLEKLAIAESVPLLFDTDRKLAVSVYAKWTPSALLVRPDGRVASHVAVGDTAIHDLIEKAKTVDTQDRFLFVSNGNGRRKPKIGERLPDFSLEAIDGRVIASRDLVGRQTLAVFWSRTCPHCTTMMSALKEWDISKLDDKPGLIVFSEGDADEHAELGLRSPIVLEAGYKTASSLGMIGTPSAVLIDEDGFIASGTAIGAANIWSLIERLEIGTESQV